VIVIFVPVLFVHRLYVLSVTLKAGTSKFAHCVSDFWIVTQNKYILSVFKINSLNLKDARSVVLYKVSIKERKYIKSSVELCGSRILLCRTMYWVIRFKMIVDKYGNYVGGVELTFVWHFIRVYLIFFISLHVDLTI
jgi:hypothetical protein